MPKYEDLMSVYKIVRLHKNLLSYVGRIQIRIMPHIIILLEL